MKHSLLRKVLLFVLTAGMLLPTSCGQDIDSGAELETAVAEAIQSTQTVENEVQRRVQETLEAQGSLPSGPEDLAPADGMSAETTIRASEGGTVKLDDGFVVVVPPDAIDSSSDELVVHRIDDVLVYQTGDLLVAGSVYDFSLNAGQPFHKPVELTIPYDEDEIPPGRTEADLAPAFYVEGTWVRMHGNADRENNVIQVRTTHNGEWASVVSTPGDVGGYPFMTQEEYEDLLEAIDRLNQQIDKTTREQLISMAEADVEEKQAELETALQELDVETQDLEELLSPDYYAELAEEFSKHAAVEAGTLAGEALIGKFLGAGAVAKIGGVLVLSTGASLYALGSAIWVSVKINMEAGDILYYKWDYDQKAQALQEAETRLWLLKNPDVTDIPPIKALYLDGLFDALPQPVTDTDFGALDLSTWTAFDEGEELPADGLVAFYPFNGNAHDESGNGNDGTLYGAVAATDRKGNEISAYDFDGAGARIGFDTPVIYEPPYSVSAWFRVEGVQSENQYIVDNGATTNGSQGFFLVVIGSSMTYCGKSYPEGAVYFGTAFEDIDFRGSTIAGITPGQWHHVVGVWDGMSDPSHMKLYIDGVESTATVCAGSFTPGEHPPKNLSIGANSLNDLFLDGQIDDLRIYNRVLSESEIEQLFNE